MARPTIAIAVLTTCARTVDAASLSLLQLRSRSLETGGSTRTGECTESGSEKSYFLGNEFIELGISPAGDFGTRCAKPSGFYSKRSSIGMTSAINGFDVAGPHIDYFLPGTPEERFGIGYRLGSETAAILGGSNSLLMSKRDIVIQSMSIGTDTVDFVGTLDDRLEMRCEYSLKPGNKYFVTRVAIKNIGDATVYDVRYHRSFDPDNTVDAGGWYDTENKIISTVADGDKRTIVAATSKAGDAFESSTGLRSTIFLATADKDAVAYIGGFSNDHRFSYDNEVFTKPQAKNYMQTGDVAIQLVFKIGNLDVGASKNLVYSTDLQYVKTLDEIGDVAKESEDDTDISASGDPHMVNTKGDAFDIYRTGVWEFLRMPRDVETAKDIDLRILANVTNMDEVSNNCTKMLYITRLSLGGKWMGSQELDVRVMQGAMHVSLNRRALLKSPQAVYLGTTPHGIVRLSMAKDNLLTITIGEAMIAIGADHRPVHSYLNMQANGISLLGNTVGGLLGEDDHSWISMRPASCSAGYQAAHLLSQRSESLVRSRIVFS